jgi:hypothetical protein
MVSVISQNSSNNGVRRLLNKFTEVFMLSSTPIVSLRGVGKDQAWPPVKDRGNL